MNALDSLSTRPYLIRALYEWCTDNGLTPYVAVSVDDSVLVPREYVKNNEIVLNISFDATSSLKLGNDFIEFKARFAGSARDIMVPISHVIAIYARENGQGMAFPMHVAPSGEPLASVGSPAVAALSPAGSQPADKAEKSEKGEKAEHRADSKVVQLVPSETPAPKVDDDAEPPEPPKPPQGSRPSLKRVK